MGLPDLLFTALEERSALFQRNAYLPAEPRMVARWGALCALIGGSMGVALHLIIYPRLGTLSILTGGFYLDAPFTSFFTFSLLLGALSLSSLGLFGLYGAVVARSGRPGLLAGAGAAFSTAVLWLATCGYAAIYQLARGRPFSPPSNGWETRAPLSFRRPHSSGSWGSSCWDSSGTAVASARAGGGASRRARPSPRCG